MTRKIAEEVKSLDKWQKGANEDLKSRSVVGVFQPSKNPTTWGLRGEQTTRSLVELESIS